LPENLLGIFGNPVVMVDFFIYVLYTIYVFVRNTSIVTPQEKSDEKGGEINKSKDINHVKFCVVFLILKLKIYGS
jgi:hypothetical protein